MKLRFSDNVLRLRLTQGDVVKLRDEGVVRHSLTFAPDQILSYSLEIAADLSAVLQGNDIRVTLPRPAALHWMDSNETGIQGNTASMSILIEKDFKCLHGSPTENADAFPNPSKT